jgi:hypothetical protein
MSSSADFAPRPKSIVWSTEFPAGVVEEEEDEEYGRRRVAIDRLGDFITAMKLHTPGARAIDVIQSVQIRLGQSLSALEGRQRQPVPVMWEGSPRALSLRNLCEDVPRTEDLDDESLLSLSVCGDICDGEGIPVVNLQFAEVFVSITTTPGAVVHLTTTHCEFEHDDEKRKQLAERSFLKYDAIQIRETELTLNDAGVCDAEPLPFRHNLAYLLLAFRGEDDDAATIAGFDDHPLENLTLTSKGRRIRSFPSERQEEMVQKLPCGAYLVNMNMNVDEDCGLSISLNSPSLARGKVSVVAVNRSEFRLNYGLCGMWPTSATPAVPVSWI